ncbi:YozE family protein [Sphingomonas immobilis]|uniref:YozE family protein n=1 Tax=Sphingomonas immobilis TaxID=3063997 RepID=A0ABT9A207_9SPHN|nr:YozE family protein [Sphingomonas sp. CA1-15]MDO7843482.1 YozE family protein [Sphingomonas sp. CA1-15]
MVEQRARYMQKAEPFGRWLLSQRDRGDWIDDLANAARADRTFPKDGDPEAVRKHLRGQQADGDVFAAVDDAETDWAAS